MKRLMKGALLAVGTALAISAAAAMPAAAATSGTETLSGTIVFAAVPGTNSRMVISSVALARGCSRRRPGRRARAPQCCRVSQDDLVFRSGTMHVVSKGGALLSGSVNPHSCLFSRDAAVHLGRDRRHRAVRRRDRQLHRDDQRRRASCPQPRRSCSLTQVPRHEVDNSRRTGRCRSSLILK